ncbi:TPA: hypothetical protein ACJG67_003368, partial [Salmonella enterica subsp. enterica serovar Kottbus]
AQDTGAPYNIIKYSAKICLPEPALPNEFILFMYVYVFAYARTDVHTHLRTHLFTYVKINNRTDTRSRNNRAKALFITVFYLRILFCREMDTFLKGKDFPLRG